MAKRVENFVTFGLPVLQSAVFSVRHCPPTISTRFELKIGIFPNLLRRFCGREEFTLRAEIARFNSDCNNRPRSLIDDWGTEGKSN